MPNRQLDGGYPPALLRSPERARQWHRQYLRTVLEREVADVARVRGAAELGRLVEIVALRSATLLNLSALSTELGMRRETVDQYLSVLERLFLLRRLPAWHRNEAKRLIETPKIHLLDSGLAEHCGKDFQGGMILYAGTSTLALADRRILAVPLSELWTQ